MRTMNLYHRKFDTDAEARAAFAATDSAIVAAEGTSWVAPADGAGPGFHVLVLPDTTTPESLGITDARLVTSFSHDIEDNGDIPLEDDPDDPASLNDIATFDDDEDEGDDDDGDDGE